MASQLAAMQAQYGGVPFPPPPPFGMFPPAGMFRPPSGGNLAGMSPAAMGGCMGAPQQPPQQQQQQQQHAVEAAAQAERARSFGSRDQQQLSERLQSHSNPSGHLHPLGSQANGQTHSDMRQPGISLKKLICSTSIMLMMSAPNTGTPRSTQTIKTHGRPGPSDQPLLIQGAQSGNSSEPLSMGRLFRPQASHARAIPGDPYESADINHVLATAVAAQSTECLPCVAPDTAAGYSRDSFGPVSTLLSLSSSGADRANNGGPKDGGGSLGRWQAGGRGASASQGSGQPSAGSGDQPAALQQQSHAMYALADRSGGEGRRSAASSLQADGSGEPKQAPQPSSVGRRDSCSAPQSLQQDKLGASGGSATHLQEDNNGNSQGLPAAVHRDSVLPGAAALQVGGQQPTV